MIKLLWWVGGWDVLPLLNDGGKADLGQGFGETNERLKLPGSSGDGLSFSSASSKAWRRWVGGWVGDRKVVCFSGFRMR